MALTSSKWLILLLFLPFLQLGVQARSLRQVSEVKSQCEGTLERREWRTLSDDEKGQYISAVKCLQSRPAKNPAIPEARSRFDEFQAFHISIADRIHLVGQFLPWHRYYVWLYEKALVEECGYKGANPYWDWSQDADSTRSLVDAPVFNAATGFGGNGVPGTYTAPPDPTGTSRIFPNAFLGCVQDGPFANLVLPLGPGLFKGDHCLTRGVNDTLKPYLSTTQVTNTTRQPNFELFRIELEGQPVTPTFKLHDGGHAGIGGEMSNFYSSSGDPLFYLHHANLDRVWWVWQKIQPGRLYEITGRSTVNPPYQNVTLDFPLDMGSLADTVPISQVMDIEASPNCYTYV